MWRMQTEIFEEIKNDNSLQKSFFGKQRGRWTRKQMRVIEIMADPLNSILSDEQIGVATNLTRQYINRLQKDEHFLSEIEKRRKSDETIIRLRARVWKALFHQIEKSPAKIRTALEALGDLKPIIAGQNIFQFYEKMEPEEVDSRLERIWKMRQRENESARDEN